MLLTVNVPEFSMAPPEAAEHSEMLALLTVSVPALRMAPPLSLVSSPTVRPRSRC